MEFIPSNGQDPFNEYTRILGQYCVAYMLDGHGRYHDDRGVECAFRPGDLIVSFPEIPHGYGPNTGQYYRDYWICFEGPMFDVLRAQGVLDDRNFVHHLEPIPYWHRVLEDITKQQTVPADMDSLGRALRLQQVLFEVLVHQRLGKREADDRRWFTEACRLLAAAPPPLHPDLEDISDTLRMSYEQFRKKFARLAGVSPAKYRMNAIIRKACLMLGRPDAQVKTIAESLGFCDPFHFSRCFRQVMGMPPKLYHRQMQARLDNLNA